MISDLTQQFLPVERDSSARAAKQSQRPFVRTSGKSHGRAGFARGGQKHLPASVRVELSKLRSRVRILTKAIGRTRSPDCFQLYRKAVKAAEFDIQELLA
jgi:hypothetical protein